MNGAGVYMWRGSTPHVTTVRVARQYAVVAADPEFAEFGRRAGLRRPPESAGAHARSRQAERLAGQPARPVPRRASGRARRADRGQLNRHPRWSVGRRFTAWSWSRMSVLLLQSLLPVAGRELEHAIARPLGQEDEQVAQVAERLSRDTNLPRAGS